MKRLLFFYLCTFPFISMVFAIEVDQGELKHAENKPIEFVSYTGPHAEIDSLNAIKAIGQTLAGAVRRGRAGDMNRYAVIHAVDSTVKTGLDADILIIGRAAKVDHINNLRVIITAYLQEAYGYSEKDASTIAHFITVYNAVYRGDMAAFKEKYKEIAFRNLSAGRAGLPLRYDEWPGNTQIVIPLSDVKYSGTLSSVDTALISDKKVVEKMREQDDMDIENRKNMIDLKERESDAARERADAAQGEAEAARKEAAAASGNADKSKEQATRSNQAAQKAQQEAAAADKRAAQAEKEAAAAKKQAEKDPDNAKAAAEADKKQKEAEKIKQEAEAKNKIAAEKANEAKKDDKEAAAKQKEAEEAAKKAQDKEKEAAEENRFADTKEQEAQSNRKDIAVDTRQILEDKRAERKAQDEAAFASALPEAVLKIVDPKSMLAEIVLFDLKTGTPLKTSSLNTIRSRSLTEGIDSLIAIAGSKSGNQMITLVAINPRTLEITKQASVPIAEESLLMQAGDSFYAITEQSGKYYLGRFNENLELQAKSAMNIIPYTAIRITEKGILVQDTENTIRLLNADTLSEAHK